jgi:vesicle transport through interaction with t-SNAREs 1
MIFSPEKLHVYQTAQVSQMEIEMQGIPQSTRTQYQGRLRVARTDFSQQKKALKEAIAQAARSSLVANTNYSSSDEPYGSNDRTRLLAGTSLLEDGTRRLQESQRIALETEERGADILSNLRVQREQIENSRNTVSSTYLSFSSVHRLQLQMADSAINRASNTLNGMIRR